MDASKTIDEQTRLWNGPAGSAWVDAQELLDAMFEPIETLLVESLSLAERILDVGCGTGSTTLAAARRVGTDGLAVGIDISEPMIALARRRAADAGSRATFIVADAQSHAFERASFDAIISRFGVMFFGDPARAFENLRRAVTKDGRLRAFVFRSPAENPFMTAAEMAAAPLLPNLPPRRADAPGQFAFADRQRAARILEEAGWGGIEIEPIDVPCSFPESGLDRYVTRLGPVGAALQQADESTRAKVIAEVRAAFDQYVHGGEVRFTAACWCLRARAAG